MKDNNLQHYLGAFAIVVLLSACASNTGPVVIRDSGTQTSSKDKPHRGPLVVVPSQQQLVVNSPLKDKLLFQAEATVDDNPKSAITLAERGLRIDRKEPRFYQVLAQAYNKLANPSQSKYFAEQGLRYAQKGTPVHKKLVSWFQ